MNTDGMNTDGMNTDGANTDATSTDTGTTDAGSTDTATTAGVRTARVLLGILGAGLIGWGLVEVWPLVRNLDHAAFSLGAWAVGGTLVNDAVLAPAVSVLAVLLGRLLPPAWRGPVMLGGVLSGVLALLAVPLVWRSYGGALLPGLHDRDYVGGLLVALAVVWVAVLVTGAVRARRR